MSCSSSEVKPAHLHPKLALRNNVIKNHNLITQWMRLGPVQVETRCAQGVSKSSQIKELPYLGGFVSCTLAVVADTIVIIQWVRPGLIQVETRGGPRRIEE